MIWRRRFLGPAICLALFSLPALAAENQAPAAESAPIELQAEELSFDKESGTYLAERDVLLRQGEQVLQADRVRYNDTTSQAAAFGNVRLTGPDGVVSGDELHLNLASDVGLIRNGRIFVRKPNVHITGTEIEKTGERTYRVEDGTFTTCDGEVPSWKFSARELDVTVDGFAWAKHVFFHVHDHPVFYLPIIGYPVMTERESGLLMPRAGYSDKRGAQLFLSYYQVIDQNMDATFYLDYLSKLGLGKGIEYRYFLGHDNDGELRVYHISGFSGEDDRIALDWEHQGTLPGQVRLAADVLYVSDREYFTDFGEAAGDYNRDKAESTIIASRNWQKNNLAGQFKYIKDLEQSNDLTLQRLPEIKYAMIRQRIGDTPLYYRLDSAAAYLYQDQGLKGGRFSIRPALSAVFRLGGVLEIVPEAGYLERLYTSSEGEERQGLVDFSTRVSTRFARVYPVNGKLVRKIRHVVQPEVVYSLIPSVDQSDLPQFEAFDDIGRRHTLGYGIVNRLIARLESPEGQIDYHEFLYLRLSQEYDIEPSQRDLLAPQDQDGPFADLRTELIVRPTRRTYVDLDSRFDVSSGDGLLTFRAETGLHDSLGNSLSFAYDYRKDEQEYLGAWIGLALLKPLYLNYSQRYSLEGGHSLEKVLNLEYRAQCWSLFLTFRDRLDAQEFFFDIALTGLGRTVNLGRLLGAPGQ
jgi:LPS-assembly protein